MTLYIVSLFKINNSDFYIRLPRLVIILEVLYKALVNVFFYNHTYNFFLILIYHTLKSNYFSKATKSHYNPVFLF